jgi:hypothetical protein
MLCPFPRMLCVFVGHPCADSAIPSSFSEPRHALAAVPSGLREARRVLGGAPSVYRAHNPASSSSIASKGSTHTVRGKLEGSGVGHLGHSFAFPPRQVGHEYVSVEVELWLIK